MQKQCELANMPLPNFSPIEVDCVTTVMLKILDGKCKMSAHEKIIMTTLYDMLKTKPGERLTADHHTLIAQARNAMTDTLREYLYEQRLYAETILTRPVMKAFKARLRTTGVLETKT